MISRVFSAALSHQLAILIPEALALRALLFPEFGHHRILLIKAGYLYQIILTILQFCMYRDEDIIRIISALKATPREVKLWQKEK